MESGTIEAVDPRAHTPAADVTGTHTARTRLVGALLVALAFVAVQLAMAQPGSASTGVPCLQTGMETVTTDHPSYIPGEVVHVSGTGYGVGCDVVVKVTRPDGAVVVGDGSQALGSDMVTTDLLGDFSYDYQLPLMPPVEGLYSIDVLGNADVILAHADFEDATTLRLYTDLARTNNDNEFALGDTVFAQGTNLTATHGYKFEVKNPAGVSKASSATCTTGITTLNDNLNFVPDSTSGATDWTYIIHDFNSSTCGGTPTDTTEPFNVAQVTAYTTSALTTTTTAYPAGATAFLVINGLSQGTGNWNVTWIAPGVSCANTSGGDRPDSDASGKLPSSFLAYPPNDAFADD